MAELHVVCRYYQPVKAPLIHHVVVPAVRRLHAAGLDARIERHWLHGPHVAVVLARKDGRMTSVVEAEATRVASVLRHGVAVRPSRSGLTRARLRVAAEAAGPAELIPGPYEPIHPDNTVQIRRPDRAPLVALLGGSEAVAVRDAALARAVDVVDVLTGGRPDAAQRVGATVTAMALHAAHYLPGPALGALVLRSHLDDHLDGSREPLRERYEGVWQGNADAVTERVELALAGRASGPDVRAWQVWTRGALALAAEGFTAGRLTLTPATGLDEASGEADSGADSGAGSGADGGTDGGTEHFGPFRFATGVFHEVLSICDVTVSERYLAAYLVNRAMARITGTRWLDRVRQPVGASPGNAS